MERHHRCSMKIINLISQSRRDHKFLRFLTFSHLSTPLFSASITRCHVSFFPISSPVLISLASFWSIAVIIFPGYFACIRSCKFSMLILPLPQQFSMGLPLCFFLRPYVDAIIVDVHVFITAMVVRLLFCGRFRFRHQIFPC